MMMILYTLKTLKKKKKTTRVFHVGGPEPEWKLSPNIPLDLSDDANNKLYNWIVLKF